MTQAYSTAVYTEFNFSRLCANPSEGHPIPIAKSEAEYTQSERNRKKGGVKINSGS